MKLQCRGKSCLQSTKTWILPWSLLINESCERARCPKGLPQPRLLRHFPKIPQLQSSVLPGGTDGCPAQPGLIRLSVCPSVHLSACLSVCLSVCPSVRACRLAIERKMAQVQQIWSIILQNHESTWIVNQKFFKIRGMLLHRSEIIYLLFWHV